MNESQPPSWKTHYRIDWWGWIVSIVYVLSTHVCRIISFTYMIQWSISSWMNDWMNERMNEWTNEWMNEWMNESKHHIPDGRWQWMMLDSESTVNFFSSENSTCSHCSVVKCLNLQTMCGCVCVCVCDQRESERTCICYPSPNPCRCVNCVSE
jgi:hypothetical protein